MGSATPPRVVALITGISTFFGSPPAKPAAITEV
jgi:hypothetical protein